MEACARGVEQSGERDGGEERAQEQPQDRPRRVAIRREHVAERAALPAPERDELVALGPLRGMGDHDRGVVLEPRAAAQRADEVVDLLPRAERRPCAEPEPLVERAGSLDDAAAQAITPETVFHTAISHTIFLRRRVVERTGAFDERLGLGAGTPFRSGEEIDYLVRALRGGARLEYDPSIVVTHPAKRPVADELVALGRREGGALGYVLAANRYPPRTILRLLLRPLLASVAFAALLDTTRARFQLATLAGRLQGLSTGRGRR